MPPNRAISYRRVPAIYRNAKRETKTAPENASPADGLDFSTKFSATAATTIIGNELKKILRRGRRLNMVVTTHS